MVMHIVQMESYSNATCLMPSLHDYICIFISHKSSNKTNTSKQTQANKHKQRKVNYLQLKAKL